MEITENLENKMIMETFIFATGNDHKLQEVRQILGMEYEVLGLKDIHYFDDIDETGQTMEENALIKARTIGTLTNLPVIADDSGLEVEALDGAPGIYSARYAGLHKSDRDNLNKVLHEMENHDNRKAQFRAVLALIHDGFEVLFEGVVKGSLLPHPEGEDGFGYDPIFVPEGHQTSFSTMSDKEKNAVSHRRRALEKLKEYWNKKRG